MITLLDLYIKGVIDAKEFASRAPRPLTRKNFMAALLFGGKYGVPMDALLDNLPNTNDEYWSAARKILLGDVRSIDPKEASAIVGPNGAHFRVVHRYIHKLVSAEAAEIFTAKVGQVALAYN